MGGEGSSRLVLGRDGRGHGRYVQRWPQQERLLLGWWGDGLGWKGLFLDLFLHGHGLVGYSSLLGPLSYVYTVLYYNLFYRCFIYCILQYDALYVKLVTYG